MPSPTEEATVRPLEHAQLVWQRALALSTSKRDAERFGTVLDLLRAAHHVPSTMLHARALGREPFVDPYLTAPVTNRWPWWRARRGRDLRSGGATTPRT